MVSQLVILLGLKGEEKESHAKVENCFPWAFATAFLVHLVPVWVYLHFALVVEYLVEYLVGRCAPSEDSLYCKDYPFGFWKC